eukprot:CAMPEP_0174707850 /NCGR_PEP_ID=MMETSP1094-20130205/10256_1 /TAXON_ID=156173 /ORGANISM="Chrysochromulina brevifilum, Strain UTEX LB 985" /LENGTH=62 /DNA_ID=CAMNT_0015906303 /DNA_START=27 /DNA_END=215 /DNA_ORIENTATION=-
MPAEKLTESCHDSWACTCNLTADHAFSMGDRSGEDGGQGSTKLATAVIVARVMRPLAVLGRE